MVRVLVVEDVGDLREVTRIALEHVGFAVIEAIDARSALAAASERFDAVVLDLGLPDRSGLDILPTLRCLQPDAHIVIVSASGSEDERINGLLQGADDYLVKPVALRELTARLLGATRRRQSTTPASLALGDVSIDVSKRRVFVGGQPVSLTRREFDLLSQLMLHHDRVLSRAELLARAWAPSSEWHTTATVTEHVRRLRQKLRAAGLSPTFIETVPGLGYTITSDASSDAPPRTTRAAATVIVTQTDIVFATDAALTLLGASSAAEVVGRDVWDFVAPTSVAATTARRAAMLAGEWPPPELITLRQVDGTEVLVELASTPVVWRGIPASQITLWSIAGRAERLRELVTGISSAVSDAVIISTADFRIESFNPAAAELYGWSEAEVIGRPGAEVLPWAGSHDDLVEALATLADTGRWHGVARHAHRDGSTLVLNGTTTLLRDDAGNAVGAISVNRPAPQTRGLPPVDTESTADLRRALAEGELVVHYQPVVRLIDQRSVGHEALVRWNHPNLGQIAPATFVPVAEASDLIIDIGAHVLDTALADLRRWREDGHDVHVSINVSGRQLDDPNFADTVRQRIALVGVPPSTVWLEVTETSLVENVPAATAALTALAETGVRISIDDFGTGWASLTYLQSFPVHALKIDTTFVAGVTSNPGDMAIVRSIVSLGQELDIAVIAEGVETHEQRQALIDLGCTLGQGWLFGRPRPSVDIDHDLDPG